MKQVFSILVVDDEPGILELLSIDLSSAGFKVFTVLTGAEALEKLSTEPIDLVFSDIRLPDMSGIQIVREIRSRFKGPSPAVVLITGHAGLDLEKVLGLGARALIEKPFGRRELISKAEEILRPLHERWKETPDFNEDISFEIDLEDLAKSTREGKIAFGWGGFFLQFPGTLPSLGTRVRFKINITKPNPITLDGGGAIIWTRDDPDHPEGSANSTQGVGIEFKFFTQECLASVVSWLLSGECNNYLPTGLKTSPVPELNS